MLLPFAAKLLQKDPLQQQESVSDKRWKLTVVSSMPELKIKA